MEAAKKGGKRPNAGRKKSEDPKFPMTIYFPTSWKMKFGDEDGLKMKEAIYKFAERYGSADKNTVIPPATKAVIESQGISPSIAYDNDYFKTLFRQTETKQDLEKAVVLMKTKIAGKWSQNQLEEYAKGVYLEKFDF